MDDRSAPVETGWPAIDDQHRALFDRFGSVMAALDRRARDAAHGEAAALLDEVQAHFEFEERAMAESGYPDRRTHAEAHAAFLTELGGLLVQMTGTQSLRIVKLWASSRFAPWFLHHVRSHDRGLARFLRRAEEDREAGLAPAPTAEPPATPAAEPPAAAVPAAPASEAPAVR